MSAEGPGGVANSDLAARSSRAALLLVRARRSGSASELLDAAEMLAGIEGDPAAACNRVEVWSDLALVNRAREIASQCPEPVLEEARRVGTGPADLPGSQLSPGEIESASRDAATNPVAVASLMANRAQAWRNYLQRDALSEWAELSESPDRREAHERRLEQLAGSYELATANGVPSRVVSQLRALEQKDAGRASWAIREWLEGLRLLAELQPELARPHLLSAREAVRPLAPALEPTIAVGLVETLYHTGDDPSLYAEAMALRGDTAVADDPWLVARCLWLEALGLQGLSDWELSAERSERAAAIFDSLHEPSSAGFLRIMTAYDFESLNLRDRAEDSYVAAIRGLAQTGAGRVLGSALQPFGRAQGRSGRERLAVEVTREVLLRRSAEGNPVLVAEARALLAEQLQRAGAHERASRQLARSEREVAALASAAERDHLGALLAQVRAAAEVESDPLAAITHLDGFLAASERFGQRYFRAEALLQRAKAHLALAETDAATDDLLAGAGELLQQSRQTRDSVGAAALLDLLRSNLELLVQVLVAREPDGRQALRWVEALRLEQQYRGLGLPVPPARRPTLPGGTCATELLSLEDELLAWTQCGGASPRLTRIRTPRREIEALVDRLTASLRRGDRASALESSRALSESLVRPFDGELAGARTWIVVPDAALAPVPFAWLSRGNQPVLASLDVSVATSLSDLREGRRSDAGPWRPLAIGNPTLPADAILPLPDLPSAAREARAVQELLGGRALVGSEATFSSTVEEVPSFDVLHFAGHVFSNRARPAIARMQFAPEQGRASGRVSGDEIARTDLSSLRLVVLAGCSSANGPPRALGGSSELGHAFLAAGADTVVGTLWDVEDRRMGATFESFYRALAQGSTVEAALRQVWLAAIAGDAGVDLASAAALQRVSNRIELRRESP